MIERVVKIYRKTIPKNNFQYWQSQPFEKRLLALEEIRQEYNSWRYAHQQGFQRVYRIIKSKQS